MGVKTLRRGNIMEDTILDAENPATQGEVRPTDDITQNAAEQIAETENTENGSSISFEDLGLDDVVLAAIKKKGFVTPSPIQVLAIPRLLNGDANVIARARTGTGKTAAFGLPLVQRLRDESDHVKAIILEPTRELAMQTCTEMASFTTGRYPRTTVVYGGASMGEQMRQLRRGTEIVVGTPGRVQDLIDRGVLKIDQIEYFILDEGDEMLDMGFVDDIEDIFSCANPNCRVLLFSATVPQPILKIAQKFMGDYEIVEEEGHDEEPLLIEQRYWVVRESEKTEALVRLIDYSPDFYGLVFVQRKADADNVSKALDEKGYQVAALHGDIPQGQREKILARFRSKKTRVLVATDVAARGIDITGLTHVVNYDLPFDGPTYVHRIGRTGRAGSEGMAVTFVRPEEQRRKLQYLRQAVKRSAKGEMLPGNVPSIEDVLSVKRERLFEEVKVKLGLNKAENAAEDTDSETEPGLKKGDPIFDQLAEELCTNQNAQEVLSSLLAATYGNALSKKRYGKINILADKSSRDRDGGRGRDRDRDRGHGRDRASDRDFGRAPRGDQLRLYVQLGWDDGYNPRKISEFVSRLVDVREKDVDAIDMANKFCLLSLPTDAALKAIELSSADNQLPHIHEDVKATVGGRDSGRDSGRGRGGRDRDFGDRSESRSRRDRFGRERDRDFGSRGGRERRARGGSNARAGVHTATQRSGSASFFKKSSSAEEY